MGLLRQALREQPVSAQELLADIRRRGFRPPAGAPHWPGIGARGQVAVKWAASWRQVSASRYPSRKTWLDLSPWALALRSLPEVLIFLKRVLVCEFSSRMTHCSSPATASYSLRSAVMRFRPSPLARLR